MYSDDEVTERIREAARKSQKQHLGQTPEEALAILGLDTKSLGAETPLKTAAKRRVVPKSKNVQSKPSPTVQPKHAKAGPPKGGRVLQIRQ